MPRVTITIPVFNAEEYLEQAIISALAQTYVDFELLIVDNVSSDTSWEIIKKWSLKDKRIVGKKCRQHLNPLDNWNRCLGHAKGDYIVFLHADDRLKPAFVESCLGVYAMNPDLGYVYSDKEYIDNAGISYGHKSFYNSSGIIPGQSEARVNLLGWHTVPVQMLIRTKCMREIGGYSFSDMLPVYLLNLKWDVGYLSNPLVEYRRHSSSITAQSIKDKVLITALHMTKIRVLNYFLPENAMYLKELKPQISQRSAMICLSTYCMDLLAHNQRRLCMEYLALARSFWLEVDKTPLYVFLENACNQEDWTPEGLKSAWKSVAPKGVSNGVPYPLPEGSVPLVPIPV